MKHSSVGLYVMTREMYWNRGWRKEQKWHTQKVDEEEEWRRGLRATTAGFTPARAVIISEFANYFSFSFPFLPSFFACLRFLFLAFGRVRPCSFPPFLLFRFCPREKLSMSRPRKACKKGEETADKRSASNGFRWLKSNTPRHSFRADNKKILVRSHQSDRTFHSNGLLKIIKRSKTRNMRESFVFGHGKLLMRTSVLLNPLRLLLE